MKAAIYARFSSSKQREESIEGQIRVCTEYALKHDLTIIGSYIDREISGKTDDRPAFREMIADAKAHKFDVLVVYKTDRFSRNRYDAAIYKRTLRTADVEIRYAAESIPDGPEGIILESMLEGFAEYYSAELAQKVRRGMHENALKCRTTGSTPFGYKIVNHQYEIDETEAWVVQHIFNAIASGVPYAELIKELNSKGIRTSTGSKWNRSSFSRILTNEKYRGTYKYADVRIENGVPRIISDDLWQTVQSREKKTVRTPVKFPLSGKVFYEGTPMKGTSGRSKNGAIYYYYHAPKTDAHKGYSFRKEVLEDFVVKHTLEQILKPENVDTLYKELSNYQHTHDQNKVLNDQIARVNAKISDILDAIEDGGYVPSMSDRLRSLEKERDELQSKIKPQVFYTKAQMKKMLEHYRQKPSERVRQDVLAFFVDSVSFDGDNCEITYVLGVRKLSLLVTHWRTKTNTYSLKFH